MILIKKKTIGFFVLFLLFGFLIIGKGFTLGTVWYVDGASSGDGTSWVQAFKTIQEAINASAEGDEIWVKMGTYAISSTINVNKPVSIYGGFIGQETGRDQRDWQANITTLDGQNIVRCFYINVDAVLDGLRITRGYSEIGGGIYVDTCSPKIINCNFQENGYPRQAYEGGAIYNHNSSPTVENCNFSHNYAMMSGGAIYNVNSFGKISNCYFYENGQGLFTGGAINNVNSSPTITHCTFHRNFSSGGAGGIEYRGGSPIISNCVFTENIGDDAGAIADSSDSSIIDSCIFSGNRADYSGSGGISSYSSSSIVRNCVFSGNQGGGEWDQELVESIMGVPSQLLTAPSTGIEDETILCFAEGDF